MAIPPKASPPQGRLAGRLTGGLASHVARLWSGQSAAPGPWLPHDTPYPRVLGLDVAAVGLMGQPGLYACWHLGVRPRWVRVGAATDLGAAVVRLQKQHAIVRTDANGGLFMTWALLPVERLAGTVGFLAEHLRPMLQFLAIDGEIIPTSSGASFPLPPGTGPHAPPAGGARS
jgi:hypothetical protein